MNQQAMHSNHHIQTIEKTLDTGAAVTMTQAPNGSLLNLDKYPAKGTDQSNEIHRENVSTVEESPTAKQSHIESNIQESIETNKSKETPNPFMPKIRVTTTEAMSLDSSEHTQLNNQDSLQLNSNQLSQNESQTGRPLFVDFVNPFETQTSNAENLSANEQLSELKANNEGSNKETVADKTSSEQSLCLGTEKRDTDSRKDSYHQSKLQNEKVDSNEDDTVPTKRLKTDLDVSDETIQKTVVSEKTVCVTGENDGQSSRQTQVFTNYHIDHLLLRIKSILAIFLVENIFKGRD